MKRLLLTLLMSSLSGLASASVADGTPFHPSQLGGAFTGFSGSETGDQLFSVKDTDGGLDDIVASLYIEVAGYKNANSFGIYQKGTPGNFLEIFSGPEAPSLFGAKTIQWSASGNQVCVLGGGSCNNNINKNSFGFYLSGPGGTFYSENALNGGADQMWSFNVGGLNGADFVLAFEDLALNSEEGSDGDHNDMVIGVHDIMPAAIPPNEVPLPAAAWMFFSGMMGFLGLSRRKTQAIQA